MNIIITLPTKLAHLIYEGTKKIEVRKSWPHDFSVLNDVVYICEKGTGLVTGMFTIEALEATIDFMQTWNDHQLEICIDQDWWWKYAETAEVLYLWHIKHTEQFATPYSLQDVFHVKKAPQSYVYTETDWFLNDSFQVEVEVSEKKAVQ